MPTKQTNLTVAVTGPTGTFGYGLIPLLQADERVGRIVGIARGEFDPAGEGWTKMKYRRGDVRSPETLERAFEGADVVVHLAFMITGATSRQTIRAINVEGTLNAFRAAVAAGAKRFVYASSVAAYGFHADNPIGMSEDWPVRLAARLFYAQEKAEIEQLLGTEAAANRGVDLFLLRPPIVLGPHAAGAKSMVPGPVAAAGKGLMGLIERLPAALPVIAPDLPVQLIHEDDVGSAFLQCIVAAGPPGAYNIAGDGVVSVPDIARELGLAPLRVPAKLVRSAAGAIASLPSIPFLPPAFEWIEAARHPAIMDVGKAKRELGWSPSFSALEALRATLSTSA